MSNLLSRMLGRHFNNSGGKGLQTEEKYMYVIAGLGNPGRKYENTRHNMGFMALDVLADSYNIIINKSKHKALTGTGRIAGKKVLLVKPQTFMNLSGESLREIVRYYDIAPENLIVIYDDMDTDQGALRIRKKGSAGSHNGMKSIIAGVGSDQFPRIRIGIGKNDKADWKDYVLSGIRGEDAQVLEKSIKNAAAAAACIVEDGIDSAMNRYNTPKDKSK